MQSKLNIGVVGCGYWGPNLMRNFRSLPDCRLRAVCDTSPDRLRHMQALYPEATVFTDFNEFLREGKLDAVVIATSVGLHYPMARASLEAGKHTFVEKPMATSCADCDDLIALAAEKRLVLMAGHTFLYSSVVRKIKEIVEDGDIGDVRYISARRLNLGLFQKEINVTWDLAPHDISIIQYIMGEMPLSVNCRGSANVARNVHDITTMWLGFSRNRSAIIQSSWLDPRKTREMTIVGSRRMIVYDDVANLDKIRIFDARVDSPPHYDTFADFHYAYHYGDIYIPYVKQEEPLKTECQHFLDCVRTGAQPITNGHQARDMVEILEAASTSLGRDGAPVTLRTELPTGTELSTVSAKHHANGNPARPINGNGNNGHHALRGNGSKPVNGAKGQASNGRPRKAGAVPQYRPEGSQRSQARAGHSVSDPNPLQLIAPDVTLGANVRIYGFVNLYGCQIGDDTKIGSFVEIQKGAAVGRRCKISSHTFICEGVTIEDEVFIGHNVTFTNDLFPRATTGDGRPQTEADWTCRPTRIRRGASIGSGATLLCGLTVGESAVVGAGSVVTRDVPDHAVVAGNPARVLRRLA